MQWEVRKWRGWCRPGGNSLCLGTGQWVPLTHSGCLDESAHLGGGGGAQFPFLEKKEVFPLHRFLLYFTLQLQRLQSPLRWSPAPSLASHPPTTQVRPADKFRAGGRAVFSLHSCTAFLPSLLIMEPCYVMETAKETSVCQALTQQGSSDQGVIPVLQEYKLRPREGKQKAPVSSSFRTQKCLQNPPASPSSPPAGRLQPWQVLSFPVGQRTVPKIQVGHI